MDVSSITNSFAGVPTDWILLGALALLAALECLRSGARRICQLALALPLGTVLFLATGKAAILENFIGTSSEPFLGALLFGALIAVSYLIVGRIGIEWGSESGQTVSAALGGVALSALFAVFWISVPALDALWHFGPQAQMMFGEAYRFWWLIGSYADRKSTR